MAAATLSISCPKFLCSVYSFLDYAYQTFKPVAILPTKLLVNLQHFYEYFFVGVPPRTQPHEQWSDQ